ncbi:MAG: flagellar hook assembly protein FlgD [Desulfovibrio sp.]|nr:flagellar hook assembly protein FlgD [Desulfovibrio sp.]
MSSITSALTQTNNEFNQAMSKQKGSTLDKDSFMLLLVTQFKYQDPLNPMDDKEFISQMAQFSSLEQMMNMNESMEKQTEAINNQQMVNATSYIGKLVSVTGNTIGKTTDGATNEVSISTFRYAFGDNVIKGTLSIRDGSGNTVYTEDLAGKQAGTTFEFNWNGLNGAGQAAPDGVYTVSLSAFNSSGEAVLADQVVDATVTGVVNQNGTVYLGMDGGQLMSLANVRQVTTPKVKQAATDTPADDEGKDSDDSAADEAGDSGNVDETPDSSGSADNSGATDGENNSGTENADNTPGMPEEENPAQVENDYTA